MGTKSEQNYLKEGLAAQHTIFERLKWYYDKLPRYTIEESPEGSRKDLIEKIDITVTDTLDNTEIKYDIKSTKYEDKITYTYINPLGINRKLANCDFSIDFIFTFGTYNIGYIVKAEDLYDVLQDRIRAEETYKGKTNPKSRYIWLTVDDIKNMAVGTI